MSKLVQEYLKSILDYNPETGIFIWKSSRGRVKNGSIAGTPEKDGYLQIMIDKKLYKAHRLAWLYVNGYFPEYQIDHVNRTPSDNRIINLRHVSNQCNMRNIGNPKDNMSGTKGVSWYEQGNKWQAGIRINNKSKHLGHYTDFQNAVCARLAGEQACGWSGCDNNSPAFKYVRDTVQGGVTNV